MSDDTPDPGVAPREARPKGLSVVTGRLPLPVEVLDSRTMRLVRRTYGGAAPLELPSGDYLLSAHLPTGGTVDRAVSLKAGLSKKVVLIREKPAAAGEDEELRSRAIAGLESLPMAALAASPVPTPARAPRRVVRDVTPWQVRFLAIGVSDAATSVRPPACTVLSFERDTAELRMESADKAVTFAQFRLASEEPLTVALPVTAGSPPCRGLFSTGDGVLRHSMRLENELAEAAAAFLRRARLDDARTLVGSECCVAGGLLSGGTNDPVGAILGAYILLRGEGGPGAPAAKGGNSWVAELVGRFAWLPDGHALLGEIQARAGDHAQALTSFLRALECGLPIFTDSFSVLVKRLRKSSIEAERLGLSVAQRASAAEAYEALKRIGLGVEFSALYLTLLPDARISAPAATAWFTVQPDRPGVVAFGP